jgi:DegV family protein with EDD domain
MAHIITDSTADLGTDLAVQYQVRVIPLCVYMNEQTYRDGVDITVQDLFHSVETTGRLPKTSAPSVADFQEHFCQPGESVYIGLSSQLSATVQNALLAQQSCDSGKVYVIDSLNLSTGIGLLALKAADLRDLGLPAAEIYQQVSRLVPNVRTSFIIETLDYLYKGGRCSAVQNLMGSLLHIRPVIAVRPDGTLGLKGRTRGARLKALQFMLGEFRDNLAQIDLERVFITHTGCQADAEYLCGELLKIAPIQQVYITTAGCVVSSHCGPGTIGILYLLKN